RGWCDPVARKRHLCPPPGTTTGTEPDRPAALRLPGLETATAFREGLSDFEAVSTGSFSKKGE
uniref:hypothetical protein n=1 Tax=Klebsiella pneumoniae TaxID=573 RepID=UPI0030EE4B1C